MINVFDMKKRKCKNVIHYINKNKNYINNNHKTF